VPTEASILSQHCQTFSKFKTWLSYPNTLIGGTYRFVLHVQDDGRFGMDRVTSQKERYYWDGSTLTKSNDSNPPPRVIDGYDQIITDLWNECRSGFANSTWATGVHPPPDAGTVTAYWYRLDLPFAWAQPLDIYVGYMPGSGELEQLVIAEGDTTMKNIVIHGPDWNANFPPQALGPNVPPFFPDGWPGYKIRAAVADEIEAGAKIEDLVIPVDPPQ